MVSLMIYCNMKINNRMMGWKLTTPARRKELLKVYMRSNSASATDSFGISDTDNEASLIMNQVLRANTLRE